MRCIYTIDRLRCFFFRRCRSKTLAKIETHLDTNNATEAWILLAMVAPNIQGHNPERVSKLLLQNLKYDMVSPLTTFRSAQNQLVTLYFADKLSGRLLHSIGGARILDEVSQQSQQK